MACDNLLLQEVISYVFFLGPSAPRNVEGRGISSTTILVSWTPPLMENGVIESYLITYSKTNVFSLFMDAIASGTAREAYITGLSPFTNYTMRMTAFTIARGATSPLITAVTLEAGMCILFIKCL